MIKNGTGVKSDLLEKKDDDSVKLYSKGKLEKKIIEIQKKGQEENNKSNSSIINISNSKTNNSNFSRRTINNNVQKKKLIIINDNQEKEIKANNDNSKIPKKNEKININIMKNDEQKLQSENININNEEKTKKKESIRKRYVSDGSKFGKEKIFKNKMAQKLQIEAKEKEKEVYYVISNKPKGLYNLGLSCYMNSLLICLYYIPELRDFFIKNRNKFTDKSPVCKSFAEVMYGLKYEKKDYFEANESKKKWEIKIVYFPALIQGMPKIYIFI